jgi:hypothetical protein
VSRLEDASLLFVTFAHESGLIHSKLGRGTYEAGVPYGAGIAAAAAG